MKKKLRWDNIIKLISGTMLIAMIITVVVVSCQHTEAVVEEEPVTEIQLDCYKYIEDIPLPEEFQTYINKVAKSYEIDPVIVFSIIAKESDYDTTAIGDNGDSEGLMQVQRKHHEKRMERLGCTDLFDPYKNVLVGVDYLAELLTKYEGNMEMALIAYNAGPNGADEDYFSKGIYTNEYSQAVLEQSEIYDEGAILVFHRTDDPVADFEKHDAEQEAELEKMPKCSHCGERIQGGYLFDIEGELYCEECAYELFRKDTVDYIE